MKNEIRTIEIQEKEVVVPVQKVEVSESSDPEMLTRYMMVKGTKRQIIALAEFMNQNKIEFKKIENGTV